MKSIGAGNPGLAGAATLLASTLGLSDWTGSLVKMNPTLSLINGMNSSSAAIGCPSLANS